MMPDWALNIPWDVVKKISAEYKLNPKLVGSLIMTESAGNTYATRYEPLFKYTSKASTWALQLKITYETELFLQKSSHGLLQLMGGTARDMGFQRYIPELYDPVTGVTYGCKYLQTHAARYTSMEDIISAYNQGSPRKTRGGLYKNERYVSKVMKYYNSI